MRYEIRLTKGQSLQLGWMTGAQNAVTADLDLCACHDPGPRCAAVKAETAKGKRMRVVLPGQFSMHMRRRMAVNDDLAAEPTLPLQKFAMHPGPPRFGEGLPGA